MNKNYLIDLLIRLSNANGVSGFEDEVVNLITDEVKDLGTIQKDPLLNLIVNRKKNGGNKPVVMLDAHTDEVGFITQAIRPDGTINFLPVGSWVESNAAAQKVRARNQEGQWISGIIASKPPHFMTASDRSKALDFSDMVIDFGVNSDTVLKNDLKLKMAAPIVPDVDCRFDEKKGVFQGKAFDNRVGCASQIATLKALDTCDLNVDVVASFSSQEEVGLRGATVSVQNIKPDIAIVFEGCPADDTFAPNHLIQTALHRGPMLRHFDVSIITNPRFQRYALNIAEKHQIPYQEAVRKGGGNDGAAISKYKNGTPAIIIGVPVRYAHTPNCYVALDDYQHAIDLAVAIIKSLDQETIFTF